MLRLGVPLLALALIGCGQEPAAPQPSVTASASGTATPSPTATATALVVVGKAILTAGGVGFGRASASATRFSFGAARAEVEKAADAALGVARERSANGECGEGPLEFTDYPGLRLAFQDGKFAGWLAREDTHVITSDGIRPGTFLRDLRITRSVRFVEGSTLDGEFEYLAADGNWIGGFVAGADRETKVVSLHAGLTCFFR